MCCLLVEEPVLEERCPIVCFRPRWHPGTGDSCFARGNGAPSCGAPLCYVCMCTILCLSSHAGPASPPPPLPEPPQHCFDMHSEDSSHGVWGGCPQQSVSSRAQDMGRSDAHAWGVARRTGSMRSRGVVSQWTDPHMRKGRGEQGGSSVPSFPVLLFLRCHHGHRSNSYGHDLTSDAPVFPGQLCWGITDPCSAHVHVLPCRLR